MIPISESKQRNCVVCGKTLESTDDIVVCPDCGAPHHRECWQNEGHCHYELAHGTDLQWHPKEEPPKPQEQEQFAGQNQNQSFVFVNGRALTRCPGCGRYVPCGKEDGPCPNCGQPLKGMGGFTHGTIDFGPPIDDVKSEKFARIVLHKTQYYLPRFRRMKKQGKGVVSWNWAAFLFAPYWFAFRKCHMWSVFALFFNLLSTVLSAPFSRYLMEHLPQGAASYGDLLAVAATLDPSSNIYLCAMAGSFVLLLQGILFGCLGNYIYKKECLKRVAMLDEMQPSDAAKAVVKFSGMSIVAPLNIFLVSYFLENIITYLL